MWGAHLEYGTWEMEAGESKVVHPPVHSEFKTPTQRKIKGNNMALYPIGSRTNQESWFKNLRATGRREEEGATFPKLV